jgi:predicted ATP-grasp superfamily ATP-dependent carboligase
MHGISVTVLSADRTTPAQYSRYARRVLCPTRSKENDLVEFLIDFGNTQPRQAVLFLTDDASIVTLHRHEERLKSCYRFTTAPWPILCKLLFKDQLYTSLADVVQVPLSRFPAHESKLRQIAQEIGYPALVKPLLRSFSECASHSHTSFDKFFGSKALRVGNLKELEEAYRLASNLGFRVLIQEEIKGSVSDLYSVGLYATRAGAIAAAFTAQKLSQVPADFGDGLVVKAVRMPELIALAERAVQHFHYYGLADIEFKWDSRSGCFKLLDFNPRSWPWINLPTVCGVNLSYVAYLDAVGQPTDRAAFVQHDFETRWVSVRGLFVRIIRSFQAGQTWKGLWGLIRQFQQPRVGPLLSTDDLLWRMFCSPAYWWSFFHQLTRGLKQPYTPR